MARIHYFSFIVDDNGHPLPGANVSIFLAGTETPAKIYEGEFGAGLPIETPPQIITNSKGFFEFWISDMEQPDGYPYGQKFKIQWEKIGISKGYIDWIDIFPNIYPVDVNNANGIPINKLVSDKLAHGWESHKNHNILTDFFPIHGLEAFNPDGDSNTINGIFTPEHNQINKIISDKYAYIWDNHSQFNFENMISLTSGSSATSATSGSSATSADFNSNPDTYNNTAHGLKPVSFNDSDIYYNKLVSNEFMSKFTSRDGIQSFTHPVSGIYPTNANHLATKEYIDILNELSYYKNINKKSFIINEKDWISKQNNEYYFIINHGFNEEFPNIIIWNDDGFIEYDYKITSLNNQQFIIYTNNNKNLYIIVDNNIADLSKTSQRKFSINDFELLDDKYFITLYYDTEQQYPFVQIWDYNNKTIHTDNVIYKNPTESNKLTIRFDNPIECVININSILKSDNRKTIIKDVEQNDMLYFDIDSWDYDGFIYSKIINHNTGKSFPSLNTWSMTSNTSATSATSGSETLIENDSIELLNNIESIDQNTLKIYSEEDINIKLTIDNGEYNNFQITENKWIYNTWGEFYYYLLRHNLNTLYTNITTWNIDLKKIELLSDIIVLDYNTVLLKSDTPINLSINIQYPEYSENIRDVHWVQNDIDSYEYIIYHNKNIQYPFISIWNSNSKKEEFEFVKNVIYIDENIIKLETFEPINAVINVSNGFTIPIYEYNHNQPNDTISVISDDWIFSNNIYSKEIQHNLNTINPHIYAWDIDLNRIVKIHNIKNIDNNNIIIYSLQPNNLLISFENNFGDFHNYFNYVMNNKVDKRGDQMSGILDMAGNIISHVPLPTYPDHVSNKLYVDTKISDNNDILFDILGVRDSYTPDPSANYINTATTLFNADQLLDTQVKIHEDILHINSNIINDIQNELNYTQSQAGLENTGSYTPDPSANYINIATTLFNADQLLDTQVKTNEDNIINNISNISIIFNSIGSIGYTPDLSTNYINTATNLIIADQLLDEQIKINEDAIDSLNTNINSGLNLKVNKAGDIMTGNLNMSNNNIISLANPTADTDATNKYYVDAVAQGLIIKDSVRVATTENITLFDIQTIDGIHVIHNTRVLVKNQIDATENGVYKVVDGGTWTRAEDFDGTPSHEVKGGCFTFVQDGGTINGNTGWVVIADGELTIGTDSVNWTQFTGLGQIVAGAGINKNGNILSIGFGAGIVELPTDEVGLDLYTTGGLFMTTDGSTEDITTAGQLSVKLADTSLSLSTAGLQISNDYTTIINNIKEGAGLDYYGKYITPLNTGSLLLSTWNIDHSMDTNIIFSVYSINNTITYPKDIELSNNNLKLHFEDSFSGTCNIINTDYNESINNQSIWNINHNLNTTNVIFSVYDNDDNIIYPKDIEFVDNNNLKLYFENNISGKCVISMADNFFNITDRSIWNINHSLNTTNVIFSVYDNDDNIIYPEKIEITTTNILLYFENNISGKCVISKAEEVFNVFNSYYLSDSISLYSADLLLDMQIKNNSDNIDSLLNSFKSITINTTDWVLVGGMYEANIIHNLNDEYPNITIWNTDDNKIEKMADIISVNDQYFKIYSEIPLNLLVKASR